MKNNTARSRTRWAAQAGGLVCFAVLLSLSPPLGFVALSCRAGKLFIQTAAPTTPSVSICGSRLRCGSGWEVVNSSSLPSRPPVRQDVECRGASCAADATTLNSQGKTRQPVCTAHPCPVPVPLLRRSLRTCQSGCALAADVCRFTVAAGSAGNTGVLCWPDVRAGGSLALGLPEALQTSTCLPHRGFRFLTPRSWCPSPFCHERRVHASDPPGCA